MVLSKFKQVQVVVLDVDGVLTDGTVLVTEQGDQLRSFHVKDGYAIQAAVKSGLIIWVISGGQSSGVEKRLRGLGVAHIHLGISNKRELLLQLCAEYRIDQKFVMYVGDDMPDLEAMQLVGLPVCPRDAAEEIKALSLYMSPASGGRGAVRDVLEKVLKTQGKWLADDSVASV